MLTPALGLTPVVNQSGESSRIGRVSAAGDAIMRGLLYEAAHVLLTRVRKWSWLKAWAMDVAKRHGMRKAIVALARRLAVIMHRMWNDGTELPFVSLMENSKWRHFRALPATLDPIRARRFQ